MQTNQPKITIIIPCYNTIKTLEATLISVQNSLYKNLDVMIIDDGSIETAENIVAKFNDTRFRYFWKENEGLGLTRNFGIDNALGEYIFFLDSDDEIYPDALVNLYNYAAENNLDVVSGVTVRKDFQTKKESEWFRSIYKNKQINTLKHRLIMFDDTLSTNKLYKIQTLKDKDIYFEKGLYEDKLFTAKLYSKIDKIGLIDDRVYIWLIYGVGTSITNNKNIDNFKGRMKSIEKLWQYIPELRKAHQIRFFFNHDLLIYLREFIFLTQLDKNIIYDMAHDFIQKYEYYIYERFIVNSYNRGILKALISSNKEDFMYISEVLSQTYQDELKAKAK